jgi:hypothetical protein
MKLFFTVFLFGFSLCAFSQNRYLKYLNKNKAKDFYWDWHEPPSKIATNISKELVFHIKTDSKKDSILEKEIAYNKNGWPVEARQYAVPSKEGLITLDSFYYNDKNLLAKTKRYKYYGSSSDTSLFTYQYDSYGKEISRYELIDRFKESDYVTEYDDKKRVTAVTQLDRGISETRKEIFYYSQDDDPDSMQVFLLKKWEYTTVFLYDTIQHTRTATIRSAETSWLRSRVKYNKNNWVTSLLINGLPSWNESKFYNVEIKYILNPNDSISECIYYLNGKRKFSKKHIYILAQ